MRGHTLRYCKTTKKIFGFDQGDFLWSGEKRKDLIRTERRFQVKGKKGLLLSTIECPKYNVKRIALPFK